MLRLRRSSESQPRRKNGQPAHSTTGVARMSCGQFVLNAEMRAHVQGDNRDRQSGADPQPAAHVDEFGIGPRLGGDCQRLQGHAADWAAAWTGLTDLGMHRAGVDGARCGGRSLDAWRQVSFRVGGEFARGSRRNRNGRCCRRARSGGAMWRDRLPCRIPGRSRVPQRSPPHAPQGEGRLHWSWLAPCILRYIYPTGVW